MDLPLIENLPSRWQLVQIIFKDKRLYNELQDYNRKTTSSTYVIIVAIYITISLFVFSIVGPLIGEYPVR